MRLSSSSKIIGPILHREAAVLQQPNMVQSVETLRQVRPLQAPARAPDSHIRHGTARVAPPVSFQAVGDPALKAETGHAEAGRYSCGVCNGSVGVYLFEAGLFDIFAGLVRDLTFTPTLHINYENAVLPIKDGLPKFKDMPESAGGSGEMMAE